MKHFNFLLTLFIVFSLSLQVVFAADDAAASKPMNPECEALVAKMKFEEGIFEQSQGYPIFFKDYRMPRAKGQIVITNGMHYKLDNFSDVVNGFLKNGYNVLVYAHRTQHESLEAADKKKLDFKNLTLAEMADDLAQLLAFRGITKKINLIGLSFGASVAATYADKNPTRVNTLSFWAPLIYLSPTYTMMRDLQNNFSIFNPFGFGVKKYDAPTEAMLDAVENYDLSEYSFKVPVILALAGQEESALLTQQKKYWQNTLKPQGGRMKLFKEAHHGLPTAAPAGLVKMVLAFINLEAKSADKP